MAAQRKRSRLPPLQEPAAAAGVPSFKANDPFGLAGRAEPPWGEIPDETDWQRRARAAAWARAVRDFARIVLEFERGTGGLARTADRKQAMRAAHQAAQQAGLLDDWNVRGLTDLDDQHCQIVSGAVDGLIKAESRRDGRRSRSPWTRGRDLALLTLYFVRCGANSEEHAMRLAKVATGERITRSKLKVAINEVRGWLWSGNQSEQLDLLAAGAYSKLKKHRAGDPPLIPLHEFLRSHGLGRGRGRPPKKVSP